MPLLLLLVVAAGCVRPTTAASPSVAAALSSSAGNIGFANGGANGNPAIFSHELDASKATGARWYRGDVNSVGTADYIVSMTRPRGMKFLAILGGSTKYLDPALCSAVPAKYGPSHGGGIDAVELLNEPDLPAGNSGALTPAQYLNMVIPCVNAVRAADPAMPIVVGAISMAAPGGPRQWVASLYAANGNQPLPGDALSLHPYVDRFGFAPGGNWSFTRDIHNIMASHGDGGKQIWATESGVSTPAGPPQWDSQASYMAQAVAQWHAFGSWAGVMFVYQIRDVRTGDGVQYDNYGLLDSNWNPKPGYTAFANAIAAG